MVSTRRPSVLATGVLLTGLLTGCAQQSWAPPLSFKVEDNLGYTACRDLFASRLVEDSERRELLLVNAAASAAAADSPQIRATVDPPVDEDDLERTGSEDRGTYTVDEDALAEACEQSGFDPERVATE
jgi:hypothetical protein